MITAVDTNVIISALLKPFSDSSKILNLVLSGKIKLAYDFRILYEYEEILKRKKFNFKTQNIEAIIAQIKAEGINIATVPLKNSLPDLDDAPFLEVAISGKINAVVTGNKKHFPEKQRRNVKILSPSEFLQTLNF